MPDFRLSIITPTYNRGYILESLYTSLCSQTSKAFEWIVVDDGSTDNTEALVRAWTEENKLFSIKYIKRKNGGKHRALNTAIPMADYEYVYVNDSDDPMVSCAVERIYEWIAMIDGDKSFAGVAGLRGTPDGGIVGQYPIGKKFVDATQLERKKYKLTGDKAEVFRKDILLAYPFPEFQNETFLTESAVGFQIAADGYKMRWFGEIICICEYLEDGLTRNINYDKLWENFEGYTYSERVSARFTMFPDNYIAVGRYYDVAKKAGLSSWDIKERMEIGNGKLIVGIAFGFLRISIKKMLAIFRKIKRGAY